MDAYGPIDPGNMPAARNATLRSHTDKSRPSRSAAATSAAFCSADIRMRMTLSLIGFALGGVRLAFFATDYTIAPAWLHFHLASPSPTV